MVKHERGTSKRNLKLVTLAGLMLQVGLTLAAHGQEHAAETPGMTMDKTAGAEHKMAGDEHGVAHPFFTHMGVPEGFGAFSLRLGALVTSTEGEKDGDIALHLETGLNDFVGLHVRNDGMANSQHTEVMFQFAAVKGRNAMSGFSPLIEFEFPTHSGGDRHVHTLIGFSTALAGSESAFNQVIHYDPYTDGIEGSAAYVFKLGRKLFPVVELSGEASPDERPIFNLLGGMKVRVKEGLLLGMSVQAPLTNNEDFTWQLAFQPDFEWGN